ncbi:aldose 1-epimerase [Hyunsoonleella flava]|uniref:aldose 1-epimerase n=1 Tax=Hyunsoonleella flava TaxID=2527939 RepID=UPI0013EF51F8|nr:aldose 1-epimerase [Hyunsoonleella flava]
MYTIKLVNKDNILEVTNTDASVYGKIYLDKGASLQELTLNNHNIIQDLSPLDYATTYASSILFPFANRIKDGIYSFNDSQYEFPINVRDEQNALHGLVFNKTFEVVEENTTEKNAMVALQYIQTELIDGFPYTFKIKLVYIFSKTALDLKMYVENTDTKPFPFTVGWHPYFTSNNLFESTLNMNCKEKIILGDRNITTGTTPIHENISIKIRDEFFDDCWMLNSDEVVFKTPKYNLKFNATGNNNFIQAYTPPRKNTIAIEPTTGVSDSFNNKIGLQTLPPNESYEITWNVKISNN